MHFPDELSPEVSFEPDRFGIRMGPSIYESVEDEDPNWVFDEMFDGRTLVVTDHSGGTPIEEIGFAFTALPESEKQNLRTFLLAVRGRAFRMTRPVGGEFITVKIAPGGYPSRRRYVRAQVDEDERDGWEIAMKVRRVA